MGIRNIPKHWKELLQSVSNLNYMYSLILLDAHPGDSGVSKDQKHCCGELKNTHCQVDHPPNIEEIKKNIIEKHQRLRNKMIRQ